MTSISAFSYRARALLALTIAYAVALQLLLPSYALAAAIGPAWSSIICSSGHADPADESHKPGKVHCVQCGWDSPLASLPDWSAGVHRVCSDAQATRPLQPAVIVKVIVGPRLSQGPPAHADS